MHIESTSIPDVKRVIPQVFKDNRGHFFESYHSDKFKTLGIHTVFVQDNQSVSVQGTLRGLHFQTPPFAQAKLVQVTQGSVVDVAVDIRKNSPSYGQWVMEELNENNHHMLYIPEGFAHGFYVLSETATLLYKCSNVYSKAHEGHLIWNDPNLAIQWPLINGKAPLLSDKDQIKNLFDLK